MALNDAVDWALELGGGVRVALIQAGTFRSDAGTLFGPVPRILWDRSSSTRSIMSTGFCRRSTAS